MMLELAELKQAVHAYGSVRRVVLAEVRGSTPREAGAAMILTPTGQLGTIGGGRLEYDAAAWARGATGIRRVALGPAIGQCCGGSVTLLSEDIDAQVLEALTGPVWLRRVEGESPCPAKLSRRIARCDTLGQAPAIALDGGWLAEPLHQPSQTIVIHGAGHVGRALAGVLGPVPDVAVVLADSRDTALPHPFAALTAAPDHAAQVIVTHDHALDLELCHRLLSRPFGHAGLIGSSTKWARFRNRLLQLGHVAAQIDRIHCPIGEPALGKHPQAIAIGVAQRLLIEGCSTESAKDAAE